MPAIRVEANIKSSHLKILIYFTLNRIDIIHKNVNHNVILSGDYVLGLALAGYFCYFFSVLIDSFMKTDIFVVKKLV